MGEIIKIIPDFSELKLEKIFEDSDGNTSELDELITQKIMPRLEETVKEEGQTVESIKKVFLENLYKKVKELIEVMDVEEQYCYDYQWWMRHIGTSIPEQIHDITGDQNIEKAFILVNEIGTMLRGEEDIVLRISIWNSRRKVGFIDISESELEGKTRRSQGAWTSKKTGKIHTYDNLLYDLNKINDQKHQLDVSDAFVKHYESFLEKSREWWGKHYPDKRYNEGYAVEAFYVHFTRSGENFNDTSFKQHIRSNFIGPLIDEAMKNYIGWWASGDIGHLQIKALNYRLASVKSIKIMANQLISLFNSDTFDWKQFHKVFTEKGQIAVAEALKEEIAQQNLTITK